MSDSSDLISAAAEYGPGYAVAGGGLWFAHGVLGPTVRRMGLELEKAIFKNRRRNVEEIARKAQSTSRSVGREPTGGQIHLRVAGRVLNDASLYDDDVQQTYVAGMLAGSRNDDGSDDRPVYYLSVIDRLTAIQMSMFHTLYGAAAQLAKAHGIGDGIVFPRIDVDAEEFQEQLIRLSPHLAATRLDLTPPFLALEHEKLVDKMSVAVSDERTTITFAATRIGALLYDWAHGFNDEDITEFATRDRPDIGLPKLTFDGARINDSPSPTASLPDLPDLSPRIRTQRPGHGDGPRDE